MTERSHVPQHRKPRQSPKVLATVVGVAVTVTGVAFAADRGQEALTSGSELPVATSAPARPTSSVPAAGERAWGRPTRSAEVERRELAEKAAKRRARKERTPEPSPAGPSRTRTPKPPEVRVPAPETDTPTPEPDPRPTAAARTQAGTPAPAPTSQAPASGTGILGRTNAARSDAGLPALGVNACLARMAQRHAQRLAAAGSLYHQDLGAVLSSCGLSAAGENVAMNYTGPAGMVTQWMNSPGHRANLLSSRFSLIGVGVAQARDGAWYGVQVFGDR
jgi:uncharacterized protein YkwD